MDKLKIGIAFSGGLARGAGQLGFIKALMEKLPFDSISALSASSIGVINALALSHHKVDAAYNLWENFHVSSVRELRKKLAKGLFNDIFSQINDTDLQIPVYITLCKFPSLSAHYYQVNSQTDKSNVARLSDVAMTYPFVNGILKKFNNKVYLDGGLVDNNPIYPLLYEDLDMIILLHCDSQYAPTQKILNSGKIIVDVDVTLKSKLRNTTFSLKNNFISDMMRSGYEYGIEFYDRVLSNNESKEEVRDKVKKFLVAEAPLRKKRYNFLTIVGFFNFLHANNKYE